MTTQDKSQILLVDDEQQMLSGMEAVIARLGHRVLKCENGKEAVELLEKTKVDLIISDLRMPVMTGEELLGQVKKQWPQVPFVLITAYGTISQAVDAMKNGAVDFITKPFSADDLQRVVDRVLRPAKRPVEVQRTNREPEQNAVAILTNDARFKQVLEIATAIAPSTASVLVQGESGTGKELIAKLVHVASNRKDGPFVAVNCAALPDNLLESELFGHEKGAFTGALATKVGKFELADGGTILLDEISEMELVLQAKLLRVLQEREVDRVGGQKPIPVDVRIVATTNRDLRAMVRDNKFREDLYYRLNVVPLYLPPLRERTGDIKLLVEHFVRRYSQGAIKSVPAEVLRKLEAHRWPGNIRELQNSCERAVLLARGGELNTEHFLLGSIQEAASSPDGAMTIRSGVTVADAEKQLIFETLKATGNNKTKAAELLGISIRTLRNKLHEYNGEELIGEDQ